MRSADCGMEKTNSKDKKTMGRQGDAEMGGHGETEMRRHFGLRIVECGMHPPTPTGSGGP